MLSKDHLRSLLAFMAMFLVIPHQATALPPINGSRDPFLRPPAAPLPKPEPAKIPYKFGDWTISINGNITHPSSCVAYTDAASLGNANAKRRIVRLMVTHMPTGEEQVTVIEGYTLPVQKAGSLHVGGKTFKMISDRDALWSERPIFDKDIIQMLQAENAALVEANGVRDKYSLDGFSDALKEIRQRCH